MADFRRKLFGLTASTLMFSGMAFGQFCNSGATLTTAPGSLGNNISAEGLTELIQPVVITCSATAAGTSTFNVLLQIGGNVPITSKVTSTSTGLTEIALTGGASTVFGVVAGSVVSFSGVSVTTVAAGPVPLTISYIRVNASVIPAAGVFPGSVSAQAAVQGVTNTTSTTTGVLSNLAYVYNAISTTANTKVYNSAAAATSGIALVGAVSTSPNYSVCTSQNSGSTSVGPSFWVGVTENFAGSFKKQATVQGGSASAVASGTRIKLVFNNIPTGLSLYVPLLVGSAVVNDLVGSLTSSETGAFAAPTIASTPAAVAGLVPLTVTGTSATAIYEITTDSPLTIDQLIVPVTLGASANTITNYLANPTLTVTTTLAPQLTTASQIPAYSTTPADAVTASSVTFKPCVTNLLFPFVTNANGFETGIAISNTTKDSFSTATQSGTCTLNFYGSGVTGATNPTAVTAPNLTEGTNQPFLAGENYAFTLTQALGVNTANPATFQGYMIAQCNFTLAHGFAYILGGLQPGMFVNPNNTAMGYLALVISRGGGTSEAITF
jgi:hypothetical protein